MRRRTESLTGLVEVPGRWARSSFLAKVLLLNVAISLMAVSATGVLTYRAARAAMRREAEAYGKSLVASFAKTNTMEWLDTSTGPLNLKLRLTGLVEQDRDRLLAAYALDRYGVVLAAVGEMAPEQGSEATLPASAAVLAVVSEPDSTTVVAPVIYDRLTLGYVGFKFNANVFAGAGRRILGSSFLIIAVSSLLNLALLTVLLRRLFRPLVALARGAQQFALGNYGYRLPEPRVADEIGVAARSFNAMCDAIELHMRFTNKALIERIHRGDTVDEVNEYQLSVVFGDAQSYTTWSQRHKPKEIFASLNRYYTCFGRMTVERFGGIIDKFMGDGVMAHFGLGITEAQDLRLHVRNALRATVYLQLLLRVLSFAIRSIEGGEPLAHRFGIASGRCLVGAIGAKDTMLDYSLIGNVVNLASRLEGKAAPGGLAIDRFTYLDAGEGFLLAEDAGEQIIKGVAKPIRVFLVRGFAEQGETDRMRQFLSEELLEDAYLREAILGPTSDAPARNKVRDFVLRNVVDTPFLPVIRS